MSDLAKDTQTLQDKITALEEEISYLKDDLDAADKEVENLEQELKQYHTGKGNIQTPGEILKIFSSRVKEGIHNINITTPTIFELSKLHLFELKATVNINASCKYDRTNLEQLEMIQEIEVFDNIDLRLYEKEDRWSLMIDGEKLIFGAIGTDPAKIMVFQTDDPKQTQQFNSLIMESWLLGKRILS